MQKVNGKTVLTPSALVCVLVRLKGQNQDEFYICRMKNLQNIIYRKYKAWLAKKKGIRPENPKSTHCSVSSTDLEDYKDRWEIITKR